MGQKGDVAAVEAAAAAPAPARPKAAFFYQSGALGVLPNSVQFDQTRKSRCQLCQGDINKKTARVKYAYHERRRPGYCHLVCVRSLEAGF